MKLSLHDSSKILFLSDVHLGAFSDKKNQRIQQELINLINYAEQEQYHLAVLGDLFDYWIEYPSKVPSLGKKLLERFAEFNRNFAPTLYITGNHDNWTIGHFSDLGFNVEPDSRILHINDLKVLLLHGDATGTDIENLKRPFFHRIIRHPIFLKVYRGLLPPKAGISVMKHFSKLSRYLGKEKSDPDNLNTWAQKALQTNDIQLIMCGHDHQPRHLEFSYGTYINLGTFHLHKTMVEYNNGRFSLVKWNSKERNFTPLVDQKTTHE